MNRFLIISIILIVIGMTISTSNGIDLEKRPTVTIHNGNTLYVGGNDHGNYTKIQDAIDAARDGDTIFVYEDSSPYF